MDMGGNGEANFESQVGRVYHQQRSGNSRDAHITETRAGKWEEMVLEFDEKNNPGNQVFSWVEKALAPRKRPTRDLLDACFTQRCHHQSSHKNAS